MVKAAPFDDGRRGAVVKGAMADKTFRDGKSLSVDGSYSMGATRHYRTCFKGRSQWMTGTASLIGACYCCWLQLGGSVISIVIRYIDNTVFYW